MNHSLVFECAARRFCESGLILGPFVVYNHYERWNGSGTYP
jgi:hypothetical protein